MKTNAEVSKDGTLTVNTFRDLKHFLDRVRYKHFQIPDDKPIKKLIIKDSKIDWSGGGFSLALDSTGGDTAPITDKAPSLPSFPSVTTSPARS